MGKKCKLSELCDVRDGTHDSPEYVQEGYPLVTSKNIVDGRLDLTVVNYISEKDYNHINERSKVDLGDIIMPMIGTIGNPHLIEAIPEFAIKNVALIKFPKSDVSNKFIYYFLQSDAFKTYVAENNRGGTQKFLSLKDIRNMDIPALSYEKQLEICAVLDKVSELIDLRKEQLVKLDQLVKSRFIELFDGKHETKPLQAVCEELFAGGDVKKDKSSDTQSEEYPYPIYTNGEKNNGLYGYTSIVRVAKEAVTISGRGTIGFTCLRKEPFYPAVRLIVAVPKQELVSGCYLQHFIQSKNYGGQGASIPQLTVPMIKDEPIPVPPMELQKQFTAFVEETDKSKLVIQRSLDKLELLKKSLMQEYFG